MGQVAHRIVTRPAASSLQGRHLAPSSSSATTTTWTGCTRALFTGAAGRQLDNGIEAAFDVTLVGRYYERFADHAVSVAAGSSTWCRRAADEYVAAR
jgi:phosphate transport system protein